MSYTTPQDNMEASCRHKRVLHKLHVDAGATVQRTELPGTQDACRLNVQGAQATNAMLQQAA